MEMEGGPLVARALHVILGEEQDYSARWYLCQDNGVSSVSLDFYRRFVTHVAVSITPRVTRCSAPYSDLPHTITYATRRDVLRTERFYASGLLSP